MEYFSFKGKKIKKVSKNGKCFIVKKIDCSGLDHGSIYRLGAHYLEQSRFGHKGVSEEKPLLLQLIISGVDHWTCYFFVVFVNC